MSKRRRLTSKEKVFMIKKVLVEKKELSSICEESNISPSQFYKWQAEFFQNSLDAFDRRKANREVKVEAQKISRLEEKITNRDQVISELMQEHLALKKKIGEV